MTPWRRSEHDLVPAGRGPPHRLRHPRRLRPRAWASLHLFARRATSSGACCINAIGPVWDGNEVWLVTGGGALFAAFPMVYATVFSGFYLALMLLLVALIFRAVAIEFRSKQPMGGWRRPVGRQFLAGQHRRSVLSRRGFRQHHLGGAARRQRRVSAAVPGAAPPLRAADRRHDGRAVHDARRDLPRPQDRRRDSGEVRGWINNTIIFFIICYGMTTMATLLYLPHMSEHIRRTRGVRRADAHHAGHRQHPARDPPRPRVAGPFSRRAPRSWG